MRTIRIQAEEHPLVASDKPASIEEYCLHLLHQKAYEEAEKLARGKTVLDLGCNHGYGTRTISRNAASVIGLDVSARAIETARRRYPDLDFRLFDGGALPFPDRQFDLVTSFQVIEHVAGVADYLAEIRRVLRPGGLVVFTTPNAAIRLDPGMRPWNRFHVREYTGDELRQTLREAFPQVEVHGLFGTEALQAIEVARCRKARDIARWRAGNLAVPVSAGGIRMAMTGLALRWLSPRAATRLAEFARTAQRLWPRDRRLSERFSTADLAYRSGELDTALDLLAACTDDGILPHIA